MKDGVSLEGQVGVIYPEITLRQYYKAAALCGLLAQNNSPYEYDGLVKLSANLADAMIEEDEANDDQ